MYNKDSNPELTNVTFSGNRVDGYGGAMYNWYGKPTLTNCILWGNSGSQVYNYKAGTVVDYSLVEGGCPANATCDDNLLTMAPQLVSPITASAAPTSTGNYRLQESSRAIDAGDNHAVPPSAMTDLDGHPRFVDIPNMEDIGNGTPPIVDLGAYEVQNRVYLPLVVKDTLFQ
jgi:hypothetical protein